MGNIYYIPYLPNMFIWGIYMYIPIYLNIKLCRRIEEYIYIISYA